MTMSILPPHPAGPPYPLPTYGSRQYELTVRQEPKQARMCGVGGKADRRPIDPPPIVQLRVIDPFGGQGQHRHSNSTSPASSSSGPPKSRASLSRSGSPTPSAAAAVPGGGGEERRGGDEGDGEDVNMDSDSKETSREKTWSGEDDSDPSEEMEKDREGSTQTHGYAHSSSYLQNPYYFMFASLAKPDDDVELHWLKDGRTRCTTGSVVSSLYHLKDPQRNNEDAGFFVFPDLSVRTEGSYRLKLSLFEVVGYVPIPPHPATIIDKTLFH
ncbi:hypothetical protein L218DRAFT_772041 [Marasmius fiardii PR-910]|nr:hypothetical protein L218DRAFT_772041 [Marasmius fiardii PR-910]